MAIADLPNNPPKPQQCGSPVVRLAGKRPARPSRCSGPCLSWAAQQEGWRGHAHVSGSVVHDASAANHLRMHHRFPRSQAAPSAHNWRVQQICKAAALAAISPSTNLECGCCNSSGSWWGSRVAAGRLVVLMVVPRAVRPLRIGMQRC